MTEEDVNYVSEYLQVMTALYNGLQRVETEHIKGYWVGKLIRLDIKVLE